MKKGLLLLIVCLFLINFVYAHHSGITGKVVENVSGNDSEGKFGKLGEIDPDTGIPKSIEKLTEAGEKLRQQNVSYLKKEWGKIFENNKYIGPVLSYTHKGFSFFNPLWKYSFGDEFSWSWSFFLHIFLWAVIVFLVYFPMKEFFNNFLFGIIAGIIIASVVGASGAIDNVIELATPLIANIWILIIVILVVSLLLWAYQQVMEKLAKESGEEEVERAEEKTKSAGKVAEEFSEGAGI